MFIEIAYYDSTVGRAFEEKRNDELDTYIFIKELEENPQITNLKYRKIDGWKKLK